MKSEVIVLRCSVKKVFRKIFEKSLEKICAGIKTVCYKHFPVNFEEISKTSILQTICERIPAWNEEMIKIFHVNIFTEKHRWGCLLKYSSRYEGLEFYLKGTQSQILSCKMCEVLQSFNFTEHYLLLGNYFWLRSSSNIFALLFSLALSTIY